MLLPRQLRMTSASGLAFAHHQAALLASGRAIICAVVSKPALLLHGGGHVAWKWHFPRICSLALPCSTRTHNSGETSATIYQLNPFKKQVWLNHVVEIKNFIEIQCKGRMVWKQFGRARATLGRSSGRMHPQRTNIALISLLSVVLSQKKWLSNSSERSPTLKGSSFATSRQISTTNSTEFSFLNTVPCRDLQTFLRCISLNLRQKIRRCSQDECINV